MGEKFFISGNVSLISGKLEYNPSSIDTAHTHGNHVQMFADGAFINKDVESFGLVRRPSTGNISISYKPIKKLSLTTTIRYVGPRSDIYYSAALGPFGALASKGMGDYTLVDFLIRYTISKRLTVGIRAENIFDIKYQEKNN